MDNFEKFICIILAFTLLLLFVALPQKVWQTYQVKKPVCEEVGISNWQCFWADDDALNFRIQKQLEVEIK